MNGSSWSQGLIHLTNVLNIYYVPGFFQIVKDEEIIRQSSCIRRDHSLVNRHAVQAVQSEHRVANRGWHVAWQEGVKEMAIFRDRKNVSQNDPWVVS